MDAARAAHVVVAVSRCHQRSFDDGVTSGANLGEALKGKPVIHHQNFGER
jgi:hypothetical protein